MDFFNKLNNNTIHYSVDIKQRMSRDKSISTPPDTPPNSPRDKEDYYGYFIDLEQQEYIIPESNCLLSKNMLKYKSKKV